MSRLAIFLQEFMSNDILLDPYRISQFRKISARQNIWKSFEVKKSVFIFFPLHVFVCKCKDLPVSLHTAVHSVVFSCHLKIIR